MSLLLWLDLWTSKTPGEGTLGSLPGGFGLCLEQFWDALVHPLPDFLSVRKKAAEKWRLMYLLETPDVGSAQEFGAFLELVLVASASGCFHKTSQEKKREKKGDGEGTSKL